MGKAKKNEATKTAYAGVFQITIADSDAYIVPEAIDGEPVRAFAIDPENEHVVYLSTLGPESLEFLESVIFHLDEPGDPQRDDSAGHGAL